MLWLVCHLAVMSAASSQPIPVAVSVPPQAYFVDRIGGRLVQTHILIPPGTSPATYEPSPQQMLALRQARLYVKVGHPHFPFEQRYLDPILAAHRQIQVVDMAQGIDAPAFDGRTSDPHIWLAPQAVAQAARNIEAALSRIEPGQRQLFRRNLEIFLADVEELDREIRAMLAPLERRTILVYHHAWGYFAAQYGLRQVAIEADGKEPGPATLIDLIDEARRLGIHVVFVQKGFSDRSARVLAAEIGARVVPLDPLAYDWLDNLRRVAAAFREALHGDSDSAPGAPR